jgi:hypothetical protein
MKKIGIIILAALWAGVGSADVVVLTSLKTGSAGAAVYTDTTDFSIDGSGAVTVNPTNDFRFSGSITNSGALNKTFSISLAAYKTVNTNFGVNYGAGVDQVGIYRSSNGHLGSWTGVGGGLDPGMGYLVGLKLTNLNPDVTFKVVGISFNSLNVATNDYAVVVDRQNPANYVRITSPVNGLYTNDISSLNLTVQGGTSVTELMSIFNDSAAGRSFTISGFVLEAIPEPATVGLFLISSAGLLVFCRCRSIM